MLCFLIAHSFSFLPLSRIPPVPVYTPANEGDKSNDGEGGQNRPDFRKITHSGFDEPGAQGEDKGAFQQTG